MKKIAFIDSPRSQEYWGYDMLGRKENLVVAEHLKKRGFEIDVVPWYETRDWDAYSYLIIRTPSDLYFYVSEFQSWLESIKHIPTLNSVDLITWNMDKHYLGDLVSTGVNVAPTTFVEIGEDFKAPIGEYVIKPVSSGGGANSGRFSRDQEAQANELIKTIHANKKAAIVQPYLSSVDTRGEVDLVFFNEEFSHAIIKGPVLSRDSEEEIPEVAHPNPVAYFPTQNEIELANKAIAATPRDEPILCARIDMANDNNGNPSIMELEYIDPVLFLHTNEGAVDRYVEAILAKIS